MVSFSHTTAFKARYRITNEIHTQFKDRYEMVQTMFSLSTGIEMGRYKLLDPQIPRCKIFHQLSRVLYAYSLCGTEGGGRDTYCKSPDRKHYPLWLNKD
jgi:hypothetical protein